MRKTYTNRDLLKDYYSTFLRPQSTTSKRLIVGIILLHFLCLGFAILGKDVLIKAMTICSCIALYKSMNFSNNRPANSEFWVWMFILPIFSILFYVILLKGFLDLDSGTNWLHTLAYIPIKIVFGIWIFEKSIRLMDKDVRMRWNTVLFQKQSESWGSWVLKILILVWTIFILLSSLFMHFQK